MTLMHYVVTYLLLWVRWRGIRCRVGREPIHNWGVATTVVYRHRASRVLWHTVAAEFSPELSSLNLFNCRLCKG